MNAKPKERKPWFQRRHYKTLAQAIAAARVGNKVVDGQEARIVKSIADMLVLDNPRFDRSRFNAVASGLE